jgi:hypothetical protein
LLRHGRQTRGTLHRHLAAYPGAQANGSTHLLLRSNMAMEPELPIKLTYFIQFLMERKMLLQIRERAEQLAQEKSQ